ncbi:hypothetical protein K431DRAFT_216185 [Polychaeton citri CBS 116435]|uniref:Uncharacterized protein n=1 Tax=Polychaeton citri CBS 116435 TaxID=1314669 RepID=A0A9P4QDH4_9PEZI|nr:hypothetical protein K431DRAFT_216185 [Polychaeton citri CBS 116435]
MTVPSQTHSYRGTQKGPVSDHRDLYPPEVSNHESSVGVPDTASDLETLLNTSSLEKVHEVLESSFETLATGSWLWLTELASLGYSRLDIARFLVEQREQSPWIYFEPWITAMKLPDNRFHIHRCVHEDLHQRPNTIQSSLGCATHSLVDIHTLRRTLSSLCGLAGVIPDTPKKNEWIGSVDFGSSSDATVCYNFDNASLATLLSRVKRAVASLCTAIAILQDANGCCNRFTALCKISDQSVVELRTVHVQTVIKFDEELKTASVHDRGSLHSCTQAARVALQCLPLSEMFSHASDTTTTDDVECLHICSLAAQFLCSSLVAYSQAHCGSFDPFFLERELETLHLLGISTDANRRTFIRARLERLTCLDAMLNTPVIVFSLSTTAQVAPSRLDVLASADNILDTWGPGGILKTEGHNGTDSIASISLRGGAIYASGPDRYHWANFEDLDDQWLSTGWELGANILVGAPIDVNFVCLSDEVTCLNAFRENWMPLGTRAPFREVQGWQFGVQAGLYATGSFNCVLGKVPGASLKLKLLTDLKHRSEYLAFLDALCGLQVSFCSGLAKRVRMRDLLAELMPIYVKRKLPEPENWKKLTTTYHVVENLAAKDMTDCESMFRHMVMDDVACFETFWSMALEIVVALKDTGLHQTGNPFVVGLLPTNASEPIRRISCETNGCNFWTKALRDTESCATFAYFTLACLQVSGRGCRNTGQLWHGQILMLQTEVHRQFGGLKTPSSSNTWILKNEDVYSFGSKDTERNMALCARVVRSSPSADPQLLIQRSLLSRSSLKRYFQRQTRHQYLQEKLAPSELAHRAFMTSSENSTFSFT